MVVILTGQIISGTISGVAVLFLAAITRAIMGLRKDFRQFMAEHVWLIATTMWTRDKVILVMAAMGMQADNPPPSDITWRKTK